MQKIYIIGPVGSGKTTFATRLSNKLNIPMYELDTVVWDDASGNVKRTKDEINTLFENIICRDSWIIEDVGREKFVRGVKDADIVYYINLRPFIIYKRCILRWVKQILGKEAYHYKPTVFGLVQMLEWAHKDIREKYRKIQYIERNAKFYQCINSKDIEKII